MKSLTKHNKSLTPGSLAAIAKEQNKTLAESFMNVDYLILIDMSGSMSSNDAPGNKSRYDVAESSLRQLQQDLPGKIGVVAFSNRVEFCPSGIPIRYGEGTDLARALKFIKVADDCDIKFILISDGEPASRVEALDVARTFKSKIDVVYIGPETSLMGGRKFLEELARATGGSFAESDKPGMLLEPVQRLMLEG